jgi:hypothetical protein
LLRWSFNERLLNMGTKERFRYCAMNAPPAMLSCHQPD